MRLLKKNNLEFLKLLARALVAPKLKGLSSIGKQEIPPLWSGEIDDMMPAFKGLKNTGCDELILDCTFSRG